MAAVLAAAPSIVTHMRAPLGGGLSAPLCTVEERRVIKQQSLQGDYKCPQQYTQAKPVRRLFRQ